MQQMARARVAVAAVASATILAAGSAVAQDDPSTANEPAVAESDWEFTLGAGIGYVPDYEGSDDYEAAFLPRVEVTYRDLIFLDGPSLGVNLLSITGSQSGDHLLLGPIVRYEGGREDDDNRALDGLGDVDDSVELGGFVEYRLGPWSTGLTVVQDVAGGHDGLRAELETSFGIRVTPELGLRLGATTSWADADYMQSYFGVNAGQAAASGLRRHDAGSGFKDVGVSLGLSYEMFDGWFLAGRAGYARLLGDAADSPIVEDEGSADQFFVGSLFEYRF